MKKLLFILGVIALLFANCLKDDDLTISIPQDKDSVDIKNPVALQNSIQFIGGKLNNGSLPSGSGTISYGQTSITVNSGGKLTLPIFTNSSLQITDVYIQVQGADGNYYTVKPTLVTNGNGMVYISFVIPPNTKEGTFNIKYSVKYSNGSISNTIQTSVQVTNAVITCKNASKSGSSGLTFTNVSLGTTPGIVKISYNTYSIPDRVDIYQTDKWLTGTGSNPNSPIPPMCDCNYPLPGFVGQSGILSFTYDPSKGQTITIVVSGCLNMSTAWDWILTSAPGCL